MVLLKLHMPKKVPKATRKGLETMRADLAPAMSRPAFSTMRTSDAVVERLSSLKRFRNTSSERLTVHPSVEFTSTVERDRPIQR